ncbi:hypothetical protein TNCV_853481 [Trichonephila clavipes]|nr:hypothetical protein TNCV_853481 [Trichonephila clavipes]
MTVDSRILVLGLFCTRSNTVLIIRYSSLIFLCVHDEGFTVRQTLAQASKKDLDGNSSWGTAERTTTIFAHLLHLAAPYARCISASSARSRNVRYYYHFVGITSTAAKTAFANTPSCGASV